MVSPIDPTILRPVAVAAVPVSFMRLTRFPSVIHRALPFARLPSQLSAMLRVSKDAGSSGIRRRGAVLRAVGLPRLPAASSLPAGKSSFRRHDKGIASAVYLYNLPEVGKDWGPLPVAGPCGRMRPSGPRPTAGPRCRWLVSGLLHS